jgi:hypothetical protein
VTADAGSTQRIVLTFSATRMAHGWLMDATKPGHRRRSDIGHPA